MMELLMTMMVNSKAVSMLNCSTKQLFSFVSCGVTNCYITFIMLSDIIAIINSDEAVKYCLSS